MKVSVKRDLQAKQIIICVSEIELEKMMQENFYQSEAMDKPGIAKKLPRVTIKRFMARLPLLAIFIRPAPAGSLAARWRKIADCASARPRPCWPSCSVSSSAH
jgi:hypothetical protein